MHNLIRPLLTPCLLVIALAMGGCSDTGNATSSKTRLGKSHLVETAEVVRADLQYSPIHTGSLRPQRFGRIFNQEEGRIAKLPFHEGDAIAAGDTLVLLEDTLLRAQLDKAVHIRKQAKLDLARLEKIMRKQLASDDELTRARTALAIAKAEETILVTRLAHTVITAPFNGLISERLVEPGDAVPKHTHLLSVFDPQSLVTELSISELVLPYISVGDAVDIQIDALGDQHFQGSVARIHPSIDERTRQGRVEVVLNSVPAAARAGQLCRVTFHAPAQQRLVIPFAAVRRDSQGEFVWVLADGKVQRRKIRSGLQLATRAEVLEGLASGEKVVTRGFLGLRENRSVKPVSSGEHPG